MQTQEGGFNKTEALITATITLLLCAIIWIVFDPMAVVADDRDNIRRSQTVALLNGLLKYKSVNGDRFPEGIDFNVDTAQVLGTSRVGCDLTCGAIKTEMTCLDLSQALLPGRFIEAIPFDPRTGNEENSDYYVNITSTGRLVVGACDPQRAKAIHVIR